MMNEKIEHPLASELLSLLNALERVPTKRANEPGNELTELKRRSKRALVYGISEALDELTNALQKDSGLIDRSDLIASRYESANYNKSQGLINESQLMQQYVVIRREILSIIDAITQADLNNGSQNRMKKMK